MGGLAALCVATGCAQLAGLGDYAPGITSNSAGGSGGVGGPAIGGAGGSGGAVGGGGGGGGGDGGSGAYQEVVIGDGPLAYWTFDADTPPVFENVLATGLMEQADLSGGSADLAGFSLFRTSVDALDLTTFLASVVTAGDPLAFPNTQHFTLEAWIDVTTFAGDQVIISRAGNVSLVFEGYRLMSSQDRLQFQRYEGGQAHFADIGLVLGVSYVVATFDGSCMCLFRTTPDPGGGSPAVDSDCRPTDHELTGDRPFELGSDDPAFHFAGRLDDVAVYNRALALQEIREHYEASGAGGIPASFPEQGCP